MLFNENQWKFTVQNCSGDDHVQLLKTNCIIELNLKFKGKKSIYSFKSDVKKHDHYSAPNTQRKVLEYKFGL